MKQHNVYPGATAVAALILLCRISSCADPPPEIQSKVTLCLYCNERTANFTWTCRKKSVYRIQWKFEDIFMANYTDRQKSLSINPKYMGRFNRLHPGDAGFSLMNVTRDDIGTYRCIITLASGTGITMQGVLEERRIDRQGKVEVCSDGTVILKWTRGTWGEPFQDMQWRFSDTTIARKTKKSSSRDSLHISADYRPRSRLLEAADIGLQLDKVRATDAGTYACVITLPNGEFNITWDLEVKEPQIGNLDIAVMNQETTLSCGEEGESDIRWVFLNVSGMENVNKTGHVLHLSSVPQTGSVFCVRQSDCTVSSIYNFTIGVDSKKGAKIITMILVPLTLIIIVSGVFVVLCRRTGKGGLASNEVGKKERTRCFHKTLL
ncbi:uncharacterized protein [Haliotis asinina]|uniref:uncharacterized protein isoform X2 n=1 Tax=Haliotis asinina TaxID=109174 RepID=UPI00353278BD